MWELYSSNATIKAYVDENVRTFNGEKGKPESFNSPDDLLSQLFFSLPFRKVAAEEINYRRFFCINDLISLRMEDERVLNHTHGLTKINKPPALPGRTL
jgi:(1->4)-alpha-D-glucan 1-alpha-D-glucosylmutase